MPSDPQNDDSSTAPASVFATTRWTVVLAAREGEGTQAREALETLCRAYWYPLYAFLRRDGQSPEDAEDLTQAFFARLLERNYLAQVGREKGRFRSFLLATLKHFLCDEHDKERAQKRGGGSEVISLDAASAEERYQLEPADERSPDKLFERRWAMTVLDQAAARLREIYAAEGKAILYDELKPFLSGDKNVPPYAEVATRLGLGEGAVKSAIHRLRLRQRELIREQVANTVSTAAEIDDEIRHLIAVLAR
ncbi:MAG: sigma-70 family RNA polymerase sigma factor [Verrucomicrobia bacterium]|nr:sigma-70 family RNA polymerase sigma factor [Verrucomicrobiota bacterium]